MTPFDDSPLNPISVIAALLTGIIAMGLASCKKLKNDCSDVHKESMKRVLDHTEFKVMPPPGVYEPDMVVQLKPLKPPEAHVLFELVPNEKYEKINCPQEMENSFVCIQLNAPEEIQYFLTTSGQCVGTVHDTGEFQVTSKVRKLRYTASPEGETP